VQKPLKIGIIGAGPSGLYFALLMKKENPANQIKIVEQNPAGATYGWGVVFSDRALSFLKDNDPPSYQAIEAQMETWDDQTIIQKGQKVRIDGSGYFGIARLKLLQILQEHCYNYGVEFEFEKRLNNIAEFADYDLVIGADGSNSIVRTQFADQFQPSSSFLSNKYVWYGTHQLFDTLSLIFRKYHEGSYVAHCYRYSPTTSTFIVECDAQTWERAGFAQMTEAESAVYCEQIFKDDLGGQPLLLNKSLWLNFKATVNCQWSYQNIVLLGDALRAVHFSHGSGTRMALEDAVALFRAFQSTDNVAEAITIFETNHRPNVEKMLTIAEQSYSWYETFAEKLELEALPLAYDYMIRSGRISDERLKQKAPRFMANYQAYLATINAG